MKKCDTIVTVVTQSDSKNHKVEDFIVFYGSAKHKLDSKGRIFLPTKYRKDLGERFFVLRGLDKNRCLYIYNEKGYTELEEKINAMPNSEGGSEIRRFVFPNTEEVIIEPDAQFRFVISTAFREYAQLEGEALIVGVSNRIEIWNEETYKAEQAEFEQEPANIAALLSKFNF